MSDKLAVWVYPPGRLEPVRCGTLHLIGGRIHQFEYAKAWRAFELSPDLPLRSGMNEPVQGSMIHPIFEDAAPDRWGRRVIDKVFKLDRLAEMDYLACAGEDRVGAMGFSWDMEHYVTSTEQPFGASDLEDLIRAAQALQKREPLDERMKRLLRPGTTAGGVRPKAIIQSDGRKWIAKFPAEGDTVDACAIEYASLALARQAGITVPDAKLIEIAGQHVVLIERFDRASDGSRHHFASARTLLLAQGIPLNTAAYSDLASTAQRFSGKPKEDAHEVFRRMLFNILMENTDDHDKNHGFLMVGGQWSLAPAYDLQPQLHGLSVQQLRVGDQGHESTLENAVSDCERFMLLQQEARDIVENMLEALASWPKVFLEHGVARDDIEQCKRFVRVESERRRWGQ